MKIIIINGPNLNLLGVRQTEIYGSTSFEDYFEKLTNCYKDVQFVYFQSNVEGELINCLHHHGFSADLIIFNAGGYTHTSSTGGCHIIHKNTCCGSAHFKYIR